MNPTAPVDIQLLAQMLRDGMEYAEIDGITDPAAVLADVIGKHFDRDQRERLLAWLREFMRDRHEGYVSARLRAGAPPDGLGLRSTRDPVSRDVAVALGFTTNPFELQHGTIVWSLCELAGWQDGQEQANA